MKHVASRRNLTILAVLVGLVIVANLIIFVPHFLSGKQMLTEEELRTDQEQLAEIAEQASGLSFKAAEKRKDPATMASDLKPLQHSVDSIILDLRNTAHPVDLGEEVRETLKLAEVLSFTMRSVAIEGSGDSLIATKTAQIFKQTAISASSLQSNQAEDEDDL